MPSELLFGKSRSIVVCVSRVLLMLAILMTSGEESVARDPEPVHRWEFLLSGGYRAIDNSAEDLRVGMRRGQLDGDVCGDLYEIFCSAAAQPHSDVDRLGYTVIVSYAITPRLNLQALRGWGRFGKTDGYYDGGNLGTQYTDAALHIETEVLTHAILAKYRPIAPVRLGFGPALHSIKISVETGKPGNIDSFHTINKLGFVLDAGVSIPSYSIVFLDVSLQYRFSRRIAIGPLQAKNEQGDVLTTMPLTRVSVNHTIVSLGVGFRM